MELIYSAGFQVQKVRFAVMVAAATMILFGVIVGPCSLPFGAALLVGVILFIRCYTAKIYLDTDRDELIFETLTMTGDSIQLVKPMDITRTSFNDGYFRARVTANAPYFSVHVKDRWLPFIVDAHGEMYDWDTARRVFFT